MSCVVFYPNFKRVRIASSVARVVEQSPEQKEVTYLRNQLWFYANLLKLFLGGSQLAAIFRSMAEQFEKMGDGRGQEGV